MAFYVFFVYGVWALKPSPIISLTPKITESQKHQAEFLDPKYSEVYFKTQGSLV